MSCSPSYYPVDAEQSTDSFFEWREVKREETEAPREINAATPSRTSKTHLRTRLKNRKPTEGPVPTRLHTENPEPTNTSSLKTSHLSTTLFDASHGRDMMNRFVENPYTNADLEAMYERRKTSPVDTVGMIRIAKLCEADSLLQQVIHHTLPVMIELNKLRKELDKQSATILELRRQIAEEGCNRLKHYAKKFGSRRFTAAPGDWRIPANEYGPGCNLAAIYTTLQASPFNSVGSAFDAKRFLRNFVSDIVDNCFDEPNRKYVTARVRNANNGLISIDHRRIMDFIIETCKHSGEPLFENKNPRERTCVENGLLKSIQFALENYRRNCTRRSENDVADE